MPQLDIQSDITRIFQIWKHHCEDTKNGHPLSWEEKKEDRQ
jgi:hypothetical protein